MTDDFAAMAGEIRAEGGTIEKFVGDAIMAVFGVPAAHEDDAVRAVRAARRMLERLRRWNEAHDPRHRLEIRVGLNTAANIPAEELELDNHSEVTLLDLARIAAHESGARTNAPLLCYLVGRAERVVPLDTLADAVRSATPKE